MKPRNIAILATSALVMCVVAGLIAMHVIEFRFIDVNVARIGLSIA